MSNIFPMERLDAATLRAVREAQSGNPPARLKAQPMPESLKRRTGMTQTRVSDALRGG